ncbi:hypothetical protein [uncultured Arthrobacter sp.]|uniref:hypothetical protein n=1 Tax=uncultured Arthrobacter sp. TaxID=114050 RepID=UPI0026020C53|nr:hypothetical protein [uncultured Arthrobacter sp.]
MMMHLRKLTAATACLALAMGLGVTGAQAKSDTSQSPGEVKKEQPLKFVGFDKQVAKENGYDIRKDANGIEYSIPASVPKGDMTGAVYGPGTGPKAEISLMAGGFVEGDCGSASLLGSGKSFTTGYTIHWYLGPSARHTWRVVVSSGYGYEVFNMDGWFGGSAWSAQRGISFKGLPYSGYVSGGRVTTAAGFVCSSLSPSDSWYGY